MNFETQGQILFICFKAQMADEHRQHFIEIYKINLSYLMVGLLEGAGPAGLQIARLIPQGVRVLARC